MSDERPTEEMPDEGTDTGVGAGAVDETPHDTAVDRGGRDDTPTGERRETGPSPRLTARTELPFGLVFLLLLALLIVVFAVQNTQSVRIQFLAWEGRFPLAIVIIAVVVATIILDELLGLVFRRRRRKRVAERAELERLRKLQEG
jgi:uncharacterized integral membrane protein